MDTIGFLELSSIAGGVAVADIMLKSAQVELVFAKASCPGKYYIMICGSVSGVENAVRQGCSAGNGFIITSLVIPRIDPQVIRAINLAAMPERVAAIGVVEFFAVTSAILAADAAVKAADVELMDVRLGTGIGGKSFVVMTGATDSVTSAVRAACTSQEGNGMLVNQIVIPNPDKALVSSLF